MLNRLSLKVSHKDTNKNLKFKYTIDNKEEEFSIGSTTDETEDLSKDCKVLIDCDNIKKIKNILKTPIDTPEYKVYKNHKDLIKKILTKLISIRQNLNSITYPYDELQELYALLKLYENFNLARTDMDAQNKQLLASNTAMEAQNTQLLASNTAMDAQNEDILLSNAIIEAKKIELKKYNDNNNMETDNKKLRASINDLEIINTDLTKSNDTMKKNNTDLNESNNESITNKQKIDANKRQIEGNQQQIDANKRQIEGNQQQIDANQPKINELIESNKKLIDTNEKLIDTNEKSINSNKQIIINNNILIKSNKQIIDINTKLIESNIEIQGFIKWRESNSIKYTKLYELITEKYNELFPTIQRYIEVCIFCKPYDKKYDENKNKIKAEIKDKIKNKIKAVIIRETKGILTLSKIINSYLKRLEKELETIRINNSDISVYIRKYIFNLKIYRDFSATIVKINYIKKTFGVTYVFVEKYKEIIKNIPFVHSFINLCIFKNQDSSKDLVMKPSITEKIKGAIGITKQPKLQDNSCIADITSEKTYTITCENATRIMNRIKAGFIPNSIISLDSLQIPISVGLGKEKPILTIIQSINTSNNTFKIHTQMLQEDIDINKLKVNGEQCEEKKIIVSNPKPTPTPGGNKTHKKPMKGGNYNNSSISTSSLC